AAQVLARGLDAGEHDVAPLGGAQAAEDLAEARRASADGLEILVVDVDLAIADRHLVAPATAAEHRRAPASDATAERRVSSAVARLTQAPRVVAREAAARAVRLLPHRLAARHRAA